MAYYSNMHQCYTKKYSQFLFFSKGKRMLRNCIVHYESNATNGHEA
jgi:hypothetical protein